MGKKRGLLVRLLLVAFALCLIFTGCAKNAETDTPDASTPAEGESTAPETLEPIEISFFISDPGQAPTDDNKIYKKIQEELGVTCKWEFLVGDKDQKIGVLIAGGEYPDVLFIDTFSQEQFMNAGALIPLEDIIAENCPNLQTHFEPIMNLASDPGDGHLYVMANYGRIYNEYHVNIWQGPAFWMQKAVLAEFGYPTVQTLDEYFDLIERYMEKYPEIDGQPTIGFEVLCDGWRDFCLKNAPFHLVGYPNDGNCIVDYDTNVAEFFRDKDFAKQYYQKLNEVYDKGLIDPESFTMTYDAYMAKLSSGRVLGMFDQHWNYQDAEFALTTEGKDERTWVPLPLVFDTSTEPYYQDRPVLNVNTGFALTVNCENPVRVMQFFDALLTEDWQRTLGWGIEGEDYMVDESGMFYCTQEQRDRDRDTTVRLSNEAYTLWYYSPKMEGSFSDGNATSPGSQPKEFYDGLKDYDKDFLSHYGFMTWADFLNPPPPNRVSYPAWNVDLVDGSDAQLAFTKIDEIGTKYLPRCIMADPAAFDGIWDEYVAEMHTCDIDAFVARVQEVLDWRQEHWAAD